MKKINKRLSRLANPVYFNEPVSLGNIPHKVILKMLEKMVVIRETEENIADMIIKKEVKCPCHLAIGQEAPAVGISMHLRPTDRGFGGHRSHSHYLASGGSIRQLFSEVLGRKTGASKGMGGSMHLYGKNTSFVGSVPIVAGTVPIAVGAALAAKMDQKGDVAIAYFGDGACEEGIVHESLNLAALMNLPIIFLVENNLYSSHLDINCRQPFDKLSRYAEPHGIYSETIDGNDVIQVYNTCKKLVNNARQNKGPSFVEAVTFRWRGHVGPDENIDVGIRRSETEIKAWKKRDPILRLILALEQRNYSKLKIQSLLIKIKKEVKASRKKALNDPFPKASDLFDYVYAKV